MQLLDQLNRTHHVGIDVENRSYVLIDANDDKSIELFKKYNPTFELVLDSANRLESYVKELNPLAYDIVEFSEKPIVLVISGAKNISERAVNINNSIQIRIVREGSLQQIIRKYRMPLLLCMISDEDRSELPTDSIFTMEMQDAFMDAGVIRLEANGRVEVIKK